MQDIATVWRVSELSFKVFLLTEADLKVATLRRGGWSRFLLHVCAALLNLAWRKIEGDSSTYPLGGSSGNGLDDAFGQKRCAPKPPRSLNDMNNFYIAPVTPQVLSN